MCVCGHGAGNGIAWSVWVGQGRNFASEGRVREIKLPRGIGMGTTMCSRTGL